MRYAAALIIALCCLGSAGTTAAAEPVEVTVPFYQAILLRDYGALDRELTVESDDAIEVSLSVADNTNKVWRYPVGSANDATARPVLVAPVERKRVPKAGSGGSTGGRRILLYEDASGAKVELVDTLATPQGSIRLLITRGTGAEKIPAAPVPPMPAR